jgi:glutaredoxin 3
MDNSFMRILCLVSTILFSVAFGTGPLRAESPELIGLSSAQKPILYGTAWCPYCKAARDWFKANKLAYINCDVETNKRCREGFLQLRKKNGISGVPAIVYRGQVWGGYDEDQMFEIAELIETPRAAQPK